jgi:anti-sigma B factor antagonist
VAIPLPGGFARCGTGVTCPILTHEHPLAKAMTMSSYDHEPPDPDQLIIHRRFERGALILTVAGEIDMQTAPQLRAALGYAFVQAEGAPLVVDLTRVVCLGAPGLTALVEATQQAQRRRKPLRLVVDHTRPVVRPIELTGLDELLALYESLDDALDEP